ncbi:MAG: DUF2341 domain-containing protein, partial [Elusimicrobiota bacterium]
MKHKLTICSILFILIHYSHTFASSLWVESSSESFNNGTHSQTYTYDFAEEENIRLDFYDRINGSNPPDAPTWFDALWVYRSSVTINSTNPSTTYNYSMLLTINTVGLISASKMKSDCSDVRFTSSDGLTLLNYWIESGINTSSTRIWVKVPAITANSNTAIYLYYGNQNASVISNNNIFIFGDDFTGANGSPTNSAKWYNIKSGELLTGSTTEIKSNQLRMVLGTNSRKKFLGLRSINPCSFSSTRRYYFTIQAQSLCDGANTHITLCPAIASYSDVESDWLKLSICHTATPQYKLQKKNSYMLTTLSELSATTSGLHNVEFLLSLTNLKVFFDGVTIYDGVHGLNFSNPYIYIEAESSTDVLGEYIVDNVFVSPLTLPEPTIQAINSQQGRYYSSGNFVSQAKDTQALNTKMHFINWESTAPAYTSLSAEVRADNSNINNASWTSVTKNTNPNKVGKFIQYRLNLSNTDVRYTSFLSSITVIYTSPSPAPTGIIGTVLSTSALNWSWFDNSAGQYQDDGFRVYTQNNVEKASLVSDTTYWLETGLIANTQYSRYAQAYNIAGSSNSEQVSMHTLSVPPNVSCDKSTNVWYPSGSSFIFTNTAGFGSGGVAYYKYGWTTSPTHSFGETESQWNSGNLSFSPTVSQQYYLHLKSFNCDNVANQSKTYGPFKYDHTLPVIVGFSPPEVTWRNSEVLVAVTFRDIGDSQLKQARHKWTNSTEKPSTGWSNYETIPTVDEYSIYRSIFLEGIWYLHTEVEDVAANSNYIYSGPYRIDVTSPTGSIAINSGTLYTPTTNVVLNLTYSDGFSEVKEVRYKNTGEGWVSWEAPLITKSWILTEGEGTKTVEYEIKDNAGNSKTYSDTITLDKKTAITACGIITQTSGDTEIEKEKSTASATLKYMQTDGVLPGKTIKFVFEGVSPCCATTNEFGVATATYNVAITSDTHAYSVEFLGDEIHSSTSTTGTIILNPRPTVINTKNITTSINSDFIAEVTLKDYSKLANIVGRTITFNYLQSIKTSVTNDVGIATVTYTTGDYVGVSTYTATFDGDQTYAHNINIPAIGSVGAGMRFASITGFNTTAIAKSTFYVEAKLSDTLYNPPTLLVGCTVTFTFQGSTKTAVTDSSGIAKSTFTAPISSGIYPFQASFAGNSVYFANAETAEVDVYVRPVNLISANDETPTLSTFTATATLIDGSLSTGIQDKTISFTFENKIISATTGLGGIATADFYVGNIARNSTYYYSFTGDKTYSASSGSSTINIIRRETNISPQNVTTITRTTFTATIELKDITHTSTSIKNQSVTFNFLGISSTTLTNQSGVATAEFESPVSSGTHIFTAVFNQSNTYKSSSSTGTVTVNPRIVNLSVFPRYAYTLDDWTLVAELKDSNTTQSIKDKSITFNSNEIIKSTTTENDGKAYKVYLGTHVAGTYSYSATFLGDATYSAATGNSTIFVSCRPTTISGFSNDVPAKSTFTVVSQLFDGNTGTGIKGKNLIFTFNGKAATYVTDESGIAISTFVAPNSPETCFYKTDFSGDDTYESATAQTQIQVICRDVILTAEPKIVPALESVFLKAKLKDADTNELIKNTAIKFTFRNVVKTASTNSSGEATGGPFDVVDSSGIYSWTATFDGSPLYNPNSNDSTVVVEQRLTNIAKYDMEVIANSSFTVRADLADSIGGIKNKTISFAFLGLQKTNKTYNFGISTATYFSYSGIGVHDYTATFEGDKVYARSTSTGNITVISRPVILQVSDIPTTANSTFTVTAILIDHNTTPGVSLSNKLVTFNFLNSPKTVLTNSLGTATTTYFIAADTEAGAYSAKFSGDDLYGSVESSADVIVGKRASLLVSYDVNTVANDNTIVTIDTFTVTAWLRDDVLPRENLVGSNVIFTFQENSEIAHTNSVGIATATFLAPSTTGQYTFTSVFTGGALYTGSESTSLITVNRRESLLDASEVSSVVANSTFTATAVVKDYDTRKLLSNKRVEFIFDNIHKIVYTNDLGQAITTYIAPSLTGVKIYQAKFSGDTHYNSNEDNANVVVVVRPTTVQPIPTETVVGNTFTVEAYLKDPGDNNVPIPFKNLSFTFNNTPDIIKTKTATTNEVGLASTTFTAPFNTGTSIFSVSFFGDTGDDKLYGASVGNADIVVKRRPTIFSLTASDVFVKNPIFTDDTYSIFQAKAKLVDGNTGDVISNAAIRFEFNDGFNNIKQSTTTNNEGIAISTFTAPVSSGTYKYYGYFDGDGTYEPNTGNADITVKQRPLVIVPGVGSYFGWHWTLQNPTPWLQLKDGLLDRPVGSGRIMNFEFPKPVWSSDKWSDETWTWVNWQKENVNVYYDWIFVRKYNNPEPKIVIGSEEGTYRRPITISNTSSSELHDYQILVKLNTKELCDAGKMRADCGDIRFRDSNDSMELNYWIEPEAINTTSTIIWVKVPTVPVGDKTIYIHYGDSSLSESNGGNTFTFFDDFNTADTSKFTYGGPYGGYPAMTYEVSNGVLREYSDNSNWKILRMKRDFSPSDTVAIKTRFKTSDVSSWHHNFFVQSSNVNRNRFGLLDDTNPWRFDSSRILQVQYECDDSYQYSAPIVSFSTNTWLKSEIIKMSSTEFGAFVYNDLGEEILPAQQEQCQRTTDFGGWASASFSLRKYDGWYPCKATFNGDAMYTKQELALNNGVYVTARLTTTITYPTPATVLSDFLAEAKIVDAVGGNVAIANQKVVFTFDGEVKIAITDSGGIATTSFVSGSVVGTKWFRADLNYNRTYSASFSSAAVTIGKKGTVVIPYSVTVGAGKDFVLKAKLVNTSGTGISGKKLKFVFQNEEKESTETDGAGEASVFLTAPTDIGVYSSTISFSGDSQYLPSTSSSDDAVTVEKNVTTLSAEGVTVRADDDFTAKATLKYSDGVFIVGKKVRFVSENTTVETIIEDTTDGHGVAEVVFHALWSTGTYNYQAFFDGDLLNSISSDTVNAVSVLPREVKLVTNNVNVYIKDEFDAVGILTDKTRLNGIENKPVTFLLKTIPQISSTTMTEETGYSTSTFLSPSTSGYYSIVAISTGDAFYEASSDTKTITVSRRLTSLNADGVPAAAVFSTFTVKAILEDITPTLEISTPVAGKMIKFIFDGKEKFAVTNSLGIAISSFTASGIAGDYNYEAWFIGDSTYTPKSDTNNVVTVTKCSTVISGEENTEVPVGMDFTAKATLIDSGGSKIVGRTIRFTFEATPSSLYSGVTDDSGVATVILTAPLTVGVTNYIAIFDGDDTYMGSSDVSNPINVISGDTAIKVNPVSTYIGVVFIATATLTTKPTGTPIACKEISFALKDGESKTATTNSIGIATVTFTAPSSKGDYKLDASFASDDSYNLSTSSETVSILLRPTTIQADSVTTYASESEVFATVFTATATLTNKLDNTAISNKTVNFSFGAESEEATTNSIGVAIATFTA